MTWRRMLAVACVVVPAAVPVPAHASSCAGMTVRYAFPNGALIALDPPQRSIPYGGCVQFTNAIATSVTIVVSGGYSRDVGPGETTPPDAAYVGRAPGQYDVTARSGPTSASGHIDVGSAPSPSSSPSGSARPSGSPQPTPQRSQTSPVPTTSATGPEVAPSRRHRSPRATLSPPATPTPSASSAVVVPPPVPTSPPPAPPPVVAGHLEPVSDRSIGLPAAVAALLVAGLGAALVRVLLAEAPVDSAPAAGSPS